MSRRIVTLEHSVSQKEFDMIMFNTGVSVPEDPKRLLFLLQAASIGIVSVQSVLEAFSLQQE